MKRNTTTPKGKTDTLKRFQIKAHGQNALESLIAKYAEHKREADEAMFNLCIHIYEQMETRTDIATATRAIRKLSYLESERVATRLYRMAHDADAMSDLIDGTQPIAYRATMRKAVL